MTDKPIIFSGPMVRAIIEGRKTQTRRVCKEQGFVEGGDNIAWLPGPFSPWVPPYTPGDRLWVRETWRASVGADELPPRELDQELHRIWHEADRDNCDAHGRCRPSIYMPRWASRITLIVEDVRVQRVQDMEGQHPSESDALAEGIRKIHHGDGTYYYHHERSDPDPQNWCDPTDAFRELWDTLNARRPGCAWRDNPWVCAVSFRPVLSNIDAMPKEREK